MRRLISVFIAGLGLICAQPAAAQVALPRAQVNSAQPVFTVDPSTGLPAAGGGSSGAVYGPTAKGSAAANPPVLIGGTADGTATGAVGVGKVTSDGLFHVSVDSGGGTGGTSSSFAAAFPATGTAIGAKNGANMVNLVADASNDLLTGAPSGAYVDGWDATQGAKADSACSTDNGTCSMAALLKRTNQNLTTLNTTAGGAIPAGSAIIGKVGIDQTTPGTTNGTQDAASSATGSAVPAKAMYAGAQSGGNVVGIIQANASAFLNMTTATTTKIVTGSASKKVYITNLRLHAGGTTTGKFVEGTGTNCGTGTADLSETWDLTASDGMVAGNGLGPVLIAATAGDDICVTNSAAQNLRVGVAYEIH